MQIYFHSCLCSCLPGEGVQRGRGEGEIGRWRGERGRGGDGGGREHGREKGRARPRRQAVSDILADACQGWIRHARVFHYIFHINQIRSFVTLTLIPLCKGSQNIIYSEKCWLKIISNCTVSIFFFKPWKLSLNIILIVHWLLIRWMACFFPMLTSKRLFWQQQ